MKTSKGALGDAIPFVFLLIGASIMGVQTLGINQAMSQEVVESVQDLERVAESKQAFDLHFHEFMRQAAEHSLHQTAEELGENGGGSDWDYGDEFGQERYTELYTQFSDQSQEYLNNEFDLSAATRECDIPSQEYRITPFAQEPPRPDLRYAVTNPNQQFVNCLFGEENIEYRGDSQNFQTNSNATDNRYMQMAHTASYLFKQVKGNLTEGVDSEYEASSRKVCGWRTFRREDQSLHENAERNVERKVRRAINSERSEAEDPFPKFDGLEIFEFYSPSSEELLHGTFTENFCLHEGCSTDSPGSPEQTHEVIHPNTEENRCYSSCQDVCKNGEWKTDYDCSTGGSYDDRDTANEECSGYVYSRTSCTGEVVEECNYKYYHWVNETVRPLGSIFYFNELPVPDNQGIRERIPTEKGWRPLNFELLYAHNYQFDSGGGAGGGGGGGGGDDEPFSY